MEFRGTQVFTVSHQYNSMCCVTVYIMRNDNRTCRKCNYLSPNKFVCIRSLFTQFMEAARFSLCRKYGKFSCYLLVCPGCVGCFLESYMWERSSERSSLWWNQHVFRHEINQTERTFSAFRFRLLRRFEVGARVLSPSRVVFFIYLGNAI